MPDTYEEKAIKRFQFLKKAYDDTDGNSLSRVMMWTVGDSLGFNRNETMKIYDYLVAEGLLEAAALGGWMNITHAGIVEIEEAEKTPEEATSHFPANVINIHGNVTGAAFQVGNSDSTQTANISITAQDVQSLIPWLTKLKENIPNLGLTEENSRVMTRNVTMLEYETQETEPDNNILKTALARVKSLLETVAGHMVAVELLNELPTLMQHLHSH